VEVWQTSSLQRLRLGEEKKTSACISLAGVSAMVPFSVFALLVRQRVKEQAGWSLQPDCAPNSKHPQFGMPWSFDRCTPPHRRFNQNIAPSVVLLQQCHCRNRHRDKLQNLSPASVLFESSQIFFYNTQETQAQKKWRTRILKFEFYDFWEFCEIFKKASSGPSAADLDHYGRGQTRS